MDKIKDQEFIVLNVALIPKRRVYPPFPDFQEELRGEGGVAGNWKTTAMRGEKFSNGNESRDKISVIETKKKKNERTRSFFRTNAETENVFYGRRQTCGVARKKKRTGKRPSVRFL